MAIIHICGHRPIDNLYFPPYRLRIVGATYCPGGGRWHDGQRNRQTIRKAPRKLDPGVSPIEDATPFVSAASVAKQSENIWEEKDG
jgi:hypothetical protein